MSQTSENGQIHRADPVYRRTMQVWLAVCVVGGALALAALNVWLGRLNATLLNANIDAYQLWMNRLLAGLCLLLGIAMAVFGLWLHRAAGQSRLERRWPPNGMKTSNDVRIRYLTSADTFLLQLQATAWVLWLVALVLLAWAGWLLIAA